MEKEASPSKIGVQVVPAFTVFQTPPEAAATYQVSGLRESTAISPTRPEVSAGPRLRKGSEARGDSLEAATSSLALAAAGRIDPAARSRVREVRAKNSGIVPPVTRVLHHA
jgi:hypothetical protein